MIDLPRDNKGEKMVRLEKEEEERGRGKKQKKIVDSLNISRKMRVCVRVPCGHRLPERIGRGREPRRPAPGAGDLGRCTFEEIAAGLG